MSMSHRNQKNLNIYFKLNLLAIKFLELEI